MVTNNDPPTEERTTDNSEKAPATSRRRLLQAAGIGLAGTVGLSAWGSAQESRDRLDIVATGDSPVDYSVTCVGGIELIENRGFVTAEADQESVVENADGTHRLTGRIEPGYGDAVTLGGDVTDLQPADGAYRLYLNGQEITYDELVTPPQYELVITTPEDGSVEYTMTTTGPITKDLDNGRNSAEESNDTVVENDDGTWTATGLTGNGYGDTFVFEEEATAFEPKSGEFSLTLDGQSVTVYELLGEEPPFHTLEIVTPEDGSVEYEFTVDGEIEKDLDNGKNSAEESNDVVVENDDGTWTATGLTGNGYGDTYEIQGDVLSFVADSGEFGLYLDDEQVTVSELTVDDGGDDDDDGGTSDPPDTLAMGGGTGYDAIVARSDADFVVQTANGLADALAGASSGDVVFVAGDAEIDTGERQFDVPEGVTLASNRGRDGAPGALLTTDDEPDTVLQLSGADARVTGLRIRGPYPDTSVSYGDGISYSNANCGGVTLSGANCEVDNNDISGFVHASVFVEHGGDGGQHVHHNYIHQTNTQGLGYGVSVGIGSDLNPTIEYNYFDENRHSVTASGENYGYVCRYNHFGPTSVMSPIDIHDPGAQDTLIERNVVETLTRTWDDNCCPALDGFDDTEGVVRVQGNWFWNDSCTFDVPIDDPDIEVSDNDYGEDADTSLTDVIPNHPGADDRPWA